MNNTAENVRAFATQEGLIPVQIDGIPEGFSFKEPDITIGDKLVEGQYVAFIPLTETRTYSSNIEDLLSVYETLCPKK